MPLAGLENMSGTKIFVALGEPSAMTVTAAKALTFQEVVGAVSFGEWGDQTADVSEPTLSENRVIHTNGRADGGEVALAVQHRTTDAGSALIKTNGGANTLMTVRKVYASGDVELAVGLFSAIRFRGAAGDAIRGYTSSFRVNSRVAEITAAAWTAGTGSIAL